MAKKKKEPDEMTPVDTTPSELEEEIKPVVKKVSLGFGAFAASFKKKWGDTVEIASDLASTGVPRISFGNFCLDVATFGGCPRGRMIRLYGQPKSAKTGSAFNLVAEWQKHCSVCFEKSCSCVNRDSGKTLWVDAEGRSGDNRPWMEAHGINMEHVLIVQPACGEQVVDCIDAAIRDRESGIGLIVLDSIAHVVSSAELNKPTEDGGIIGRNAMLMNSAMRKWTAALTAQGVSSKTKPTIILLNQIRSKTDGYGNPNTQPGGRGHGYATSLDIEFTARGVHYLVDDGKGNFTDKKTSGGAKGFTPEANATADYAEIEFKVTQSSVCPVGRYGEFNYWLREAHGHRSGDPDNVDRLFDYAKSYGLIEKTGVSYTFKTLKETSQEKLKAALSADKELQAQVWTELVEKLKK